MKRIILSIAVTCVLGILSAPLLAGDGVPSNIVKVNQYYHGGYHGNYHGGYHAAYHGGYRGGYYGGYYGGAVVYNAFPPLWNYPVTSTLFPPIPPPVVPQPVYPTYYYPGASFYYSSPELSIGVGF